MSVREILLLPSVLVKWVLTALNNTYTSLNFSSWQFAAMPPWIFPDFSIEFELGKMLGMHGQLLSISGTKTSCPKGSSEWHPSLLQGTSRHVRIWSLPSDLPTASCCSSRGSPLPQGGTSLIPATVQPLRGKEGSISCSVWWLHRCTKDFFF